MSNILKVSNSVPGFDNTANKQNPTQAEHIGIKNPVDPNRVTRPDGRSETNSEQDVRQGLHAESNFANFIGSLRESPRLTETMTKFLFTRMGSLVEAGIGAGTAQEIEELLQMLELQPDGLKTFLKNQMSGANRMQGRMFDLLRQVMNGATSVELKSNILEFLKKYNDLSSSKHLLTNIRSLLDEIQGYMFRNDAEALKKLAAGLKPYSQQGQPANVQLLKEQIIPLLGKYISETRDMGKIRDLINLLSYNTARYENGTLDSMMQAFRRLSEFSAFQKAFGGMGEDEFRQILQNVDFDRAAGQSEWSDKLLNIIRSGIRGEAGLENRENFLNIIRGTLINESVYMPVLHAMLPMIIDGTPVFSEMWVDPDEESAREGGGRKKGVKLLLKFDMKDVGFFDIMMYYGEGKMDMLLRYPENLAEHEDEIRSGITDILKKNEMQVNYFAVEKGKESIPVSAAFPKIIERRNSINVTA